MATTGSLFASQVCPSPVMGYPPWSTGALVATKPSCQLLPLSVLTVNLVVFQLVSPGKFQGLRVEEKSLMAATSIFGLFGSTAMCCSASGTVVVVLTVGPTV